MFRYTEVFKYNRVQRTVPTLTMALNNTDCLFGPLFTGGMTVCPGTTRFEAAAMAPVDIHASTRVPPHALWMSAIGRVPVCIRAMSLTVM